MWRKENGSVKGLQGKGKIGQSEGRKEERKETSLACFLVEFLFFFQHEEEGSASDFSLVHGSVLQSTLITQDVTLNTKCAKR